MAKTFGLLLNRSLEKYALRACYLLAIKLPYKLNIFEAFF